MLIKSDSFLVMRCPFAGFNCKGPDCAVWRWQDHDTGWCGAGGKPTPRPPKELVRPTPSEPIGRIDRNNKKGAVERTRR